MPAIPKPKKASFAISLIDLLLALGMFILYWTYKADLHFSEFMSTMQNGIFKANFRENASLFMLFYCIAPVIFSFLGLFGKLGRTVNILAFVSFAVAAFIYFFSFAAVNAAFDFTSAANACYSSSFLVCLVALLTSFINLEKSK